MKCDNYKQLIERIVEQDISNDQINVLTKHIEKCENCKQEYNSTITYMEISHKLKQNMPILENKEAFIDGIIEQLDDKVQANKKGIHIQLPIFNSSFRRLIATLAATLIMFFMIQQALDIWQITQLEARVSKPENTLDYKTMKAVLLVKLMDKSISHNSLLQLLNKKTFSYLKEEIAQFNHNNNYLKLRLSKLTGSNLNFLSDSNNYSLKMNKK